MIQLDLVGIALLSYVDQLSHLKNIESSIETQLRKVTTYSLGYS